MNTLAMTINPASTSESIIQLAAGKSLAIVSGVITPTGLTNTTIYVDGVAGSTVTADYHRIVITFDDVACTDVQIGYDGSNYFDGLFGNVQIWNAAFDADDVAFDYLNCYQNLTADNRPGTSLTSANLKGHWSLIAGSGDVAYDYSGNDNHGTLIGFATDDSQWSNASALDSPLAIQTALCEWGMGNNILPYSDEFESVWRTTGASLSSGGVRLDGRPAILLTEDATKLHHRVEYTAQGLLAGLNKVQAKVKKATKDDVTIRLVNGTDGDIARAKLIFSTGNLTVYNGTAEVTELQDGWFLIEAEGNSTVDDTKIFLGTMFSAEGIDGPAFYIDGVQAVNGDIDIGAATITHAQSVNNALTPIRSWETAGQFKRDYSELNFNGRSYADCGNGADVNPSTALIIEYLCKREKRAQTQTIASKNGIFMCRLSFTTNDDLVRVQVYTETDSLSVVIDYPSSALYHCIFLYDSTSGEAKLYINGALADIDTTTTSDKTIRNNSNSLILGAKTAVGEMATAQLPLFKMHIDSEAQAIIDGDLDAWVAKRYAKAAAKYGL